MALRGDSPLTLTSPSASLSKELLTTVNLYSFRDLLVSFSVLPPGCPFRRALLIAWNTKVSAFFKPFSNVKYIKEEYRTFAKTVLDEQSDDVLELRLLSDFDDLDVDIISASRAVLNRTDLVLSPKQTTSSIKAPLPESDISIDLIPYATNCPHSPVCEVYEPSDDFAICSYCSRQCIKVLRELHKLDYQKTEAYRLKIKSRKKISLLYTLAEILTAYFLMKFPLHSDKISVEKTYNALKRLARKENCSKTGHIVVSYDKEFNRKSIKFAPHRCHSVSCAICEFEKSRETLSEVSEVFEEIAQSKHIAFWTLTTPATLNPFVGVEQLRTAINRLRLYKIRKSRLSYFDDLFEKAIKEYELELRAKGFPESEIRRKIMLQKFFHKLFMDRVRQKLQESEKGYVAFYETGKFVIKFETNVKDGGYNFHAHILTDVLISKIFLSVFAKELGLGHIVDVRAVRGREAVKEIAKYITKTSQFDNLCVFSNILFEISVQSVRRLRVWNVERPQNIKEKEKEEVSIKFVKTAIYSTENDFRKKYRRSKYKKTTEFLSDLYIYDVKYPVRKASHYLSSVKDRLELERIGKYYVHKGNYECIVDAEKLFIVETNELAHKLLSISLTLLKDFTPLELKVFRKCVKRFFKKSDFHKHFGYYGRFLKLAKEYALEVRDEESFEKAVVNLQNDLLALTHKEVALLLVISHMYIIRIMHFNYVEGGGRCLNAV